MLVYVNEEIDKFIAENYGEVSKEMRIAISNTFELYWDKDGYRSAALKTLRKYAPTPPLPDLGNTK